MKNMKESFFALKFKLYLLFALIIAALVLDVTTISIHQIEYMSSIIVSVAGIVVFFYLMRDLTRQNRSIKHRDDMLSTVSTAVSLFSQADPDDFESALLEGMGLMAKSVDADRMYIWENHVKDGKLYCNQTYEWSEYVEPQQDSKYVVDIPYDENIPGWKEKFLRGECVNDLVRNLSPEEQAQLTPQGIKSIITLPVYLQDEFWGFVGFDDCKRERLFTANEEAVLRSASVLFANAVLRNEMVNDLLDKSIRLEAAVEEANAASQAKSDFLSNMSHEMRTPMSAIIGMTAIGRKADELEGKNRALEKIGEASSHLLGVINDILDMAKIEADKLELEPVRFSFEKMLSNVLTVVNYRADEKQQSMTVSVDESVPSFMIGDDQRLAQVLTNLLSNAVKFTREEGEIRLDATLAGEKDGVCELKIQISDNGIGISPEQINKLFAAFEQADRGTSRKYGGTGLGLAITKRIVNKMGGSIWVESDLGKGSTFSFTVNVGRGVIDEKASDDCLLEVQGELIPAMNTGELSGRKILVAEDVEINREIVVALLEETGVHIDCAENGKEALKMISEEPEKYDIVFMDMRMPEMDGLEATRRIRGLAPRQRDRLPIIAMTANVFKDDIEACLAAGMDDHIGKPLDLDRIIRTLRKYCMMVS